MQAHAVDAASVRPLRQRVMRPHQAAEQLVYRGDGAADTLHAAIRAEDGATVAVASVMRERCPCARLGANWRLRGMAVEEAQRGRGFGTELLALCEAHVREHGGVGIWCNARTGVVGFYERAGFTVVGEEFEIAHIGPHRLAVKVL
jgi:ribosomal protein S18 acetylase RimI-like enzyme